MNAFWIVLFASPVLLLIAAALLAVIVIGIRRGDRCDLTKPAQNRIDSISRRIAGVGTRNHSNREEGDR